MAVVTYTGYALDSIRKWTGSNGLSGYWETGSIPVDLSTFTPVTLGRIVTGTLTTGDLLDIEAWARVTNDVGMHLDPDGQTYTVGIGWYMKAYEYTTPGVVGPLFDIESMNGQNVTPNGQTHHMPLHWSGLYEVPAEWNGKRLVLMFRADAHSSAWATNGGNDVITIDQGYGRFTVAHLKKTGV